MKATGLDCLQNQIKCLTAISRSVLIWATLTALIGLVRAELADRPALCRGTSTLGGETTHIHTSRTTLSFVWIIASVSCRHRGTRPHRLRKTRPPQSSLVLSTSTAKRNYSSRQILFISIIVISIICGYLQPKPASCQWFWQNSKKKIII